jgi:hypothetical protein
MSDPTRPSHPSRSNGALFVSAHVAQDRSEPAAHQAVAVRAYAKFVARGGVHGRDREDWAAARAELLAEGRAPQRSGEA